MKLVDRYQVEGTDPAIYIGHRPYRRADGTLGVSKTWYAEYNHGSQCHYEKLGERNKQAAIRAANRIVERIERGEMKPVVRKVEWTELQDGYIEFNTNRNRAPRTIAKYTHGMKSLLEFAEIRGVTLPAKFTPDDFWAFSQYLRKLGKEPKTICDRLVFTKQVFKWGLAKAKLLQENPLAGETVDEPPPTEQPCFTSAQVNALLEKASPADRPVFALMAHTGMRFGEVRELRWCDIHLDRGRHGQVYVKRGGSRGMTKGKANRVIPVHPALRKVLDELPRTGELVFYEPSETLRNPEKAVALIERKLLARLKRTCKVAAFVNPKQYKLHTFRHAFASMCAKENTSYKYALEWLGHKSSDILDLYYKMYDDVADNAMAKISYAVPAPQGKAA